MAFNDLSMGSHRLRPTFMLCAKKKRQSGREKEPTRHRFIISTLRWKPGSSSCTSGRARTPTCRPNWIMCGLNCWCCRPRTSYLRARKQPRG
eukprot:356731-Chlamydomonas_euryale.AAC.12